MRDRDRDEHEALSNEDKAVYASQNAVAIEVLERRIERRLSEFRTRLTVVEERMLNMNEISKDNNARLRKLELFFYILIGLAGGNLVGLVTLLTKVGK